MGITMGIILTRNESQKGRERRGSWAGRADGACVKRSHHDVRATQSQHDVRAKWGECILIQNLVQQAIFTPWTHLILEEIIILVGGAIPPAPAVAASTRMSARMKRVGNTVHP